MNNCLLAGCQLIVSWDQCFGYLDQLRTMNAYMNESWVIFFECTPACELRGTALSKVHVQLAKKCAFRPQAVLPRLRKARGKRAGVAIHAVYRDTGGFAKGGASRPPLWHTPLKVHFSCSFTVFSSPTIPTKHVFPAEIHCFCVPGCNF